ncbi:MAG: metallophosphoesterase [Nitrospirae bacterium]|nr:metallophosphoesterase [Nitrospirota bacterium]
MKLSRRSFIKIGALSIPSLILADGFLVEAEAYKINHISMGQAFGIKCVHISDIHFKGDKAYLNRIVEEINSLGPELVFFTGDLIEDSKFLSVSLELLGNLRAPVYGVPGNHDFTSKAPFSEISKAFEKTGGAWLVDDLVKLPEFGINIFGATCHKAFHLDDPEATILLSHYPVIVNGLSRKHKLILSGHSHGGQVRIPFWGPLYLPPYVDKYDMGFFNTDAGPLYVNPGLGYFHLPVRFFCRPEITVFSL